MMGTQHKIIGVGCGAAAAIYLTETTGDYKLGAAALVMSTIGAMFPDIDHDNSRLGQKRKRMTKAFTRMSIIAALAGTILLASIAFGRLDAQSDIIMLITGMSIFAIMIAGAHIISHTKTGQWMFHHRGFTHTLIIPGAGFLLQNCFSSEYWKYSCLGFVIGYLSHLIADMMTVQGCPILWPLTKRNFRICKFQTGTKATWFATIFLTLVPVFAVLSVVGKIPVFTGLS